MDNANNVDNSSTSKDADEKAPPSELAQALSRMSHEGQLGGQIRALRRRAGERRWSYPSMARAATGRASHRHAALVRCWTGGLVMPEWENLKRLVKAMGATQEEVEAFRAARERVTAPRLTPPRPAPGPSPAKNVAWLLLPHLVALLAFALDLGFGTLTGITFSVAFDNDPDLSTWKLLLGILANLGVASTAMALAARLTDSTAWAVIIFIGWLPALLLGLSLPDITAGI
ncbi:helix-turn-helix transcriptional regulator [Streptomyces sp. NBC_00572]|uniref:helix-turn-helix domain-containing protein n=1 Tax=Streptomyces sp. NBC_00572 TaxID=2903664 RepID=UPI0022517F7D|nr:helix-turn-helix transcriptional regulator [Streptomyces sp. NBC_00572]MCX4987033.1 helix-turn-helix domain-containing protein [Streptomyces sp. NBC_00572]